MSLLSSAAHSVLHPVQFADHVGDALWHEVGKKVLGGATTNEEVYGQPFTPAQVASARAYKAAH